MDACDLNLTVQYRNQNLASSQGIQDMSPWMCVGVDSRDAILTDMALASITWYMSKQSI